LQKAEKKLGKKENWKANAAGGHITQNNHATELNADQLSLTNPARRTTSQRTCWWTLSVRRWVW